ncbi:MAG TPA: mechanosensitive ion channel family protein, partial [Candidatus Dormibacteraeota bacterium]|nr:mechanosensitive ion channel family protein [Candidatus Dormibacteraeota bacterium]
MLADLRCEPTLWFDPICRGIAAHDPTGIAGPIVERLIGPLAIFIVLYLLGRLARRIVDATLRETSTDRQVRTLVHNVMTAVTYLVAVMSAIVVAGVNIAVLLTVAGLGTVAIGLALQDILRNVLAGIWLLLERPFRLGDNIAVLDQAGVVQNITLRTTTLRTGDGRLSVLPNLTAFSNPVVNSSSFQLRQYSVTVREPADVNLEAALTDARKALASVRHVAAKPAPNVVPQLDGKTVLLRCTYW